MSWQADYINNKFKTSFFEDRLPPIWVTADTYKDRSTWNLELVGYSEPDLLAREDRPVLMKGSLVARIASRASTTGQCANRYCQDVVTRYLERIKYSEANHSKRYDFIQGLLMRVSEDRYTTHHLYKYDWHYVYIKGVKHYYFRGDKPVKVGSDFGLKFNS